MPFGVRFETNDLTDTRGKKMTGVGSPDEHSKYEASTHWELLQAEWHHTFSRRERNRLSDDDVAEIREQLPMGPPSPQRVEELAEELGIYPLSVFRIWAGVTFQRRKAFPKWHPMRLNINVENAAKQRERYQLSKINILAIGERQEWRCAYCQAELKGKGSPFSEGRKYHRDHIVPLVQGGETIEGNIHLTCSLCNTSKNALSDSDFRVKLNRIQRALHKREGFQLIVDILLPVVESTLWADSDSASCVFCGKVAVLVSKADLPGESAVFECRTCKKLWRCANYLGKTDFWADLNYTFFGRWYAMDSDGLQRIIDNVENGHASLRPLIADWAGGVQQVRKRKHTHNRSEGCWCEFGGDSYVPIGDVMPQLSLISR
ncbi:MAG: HNH endonuclease [Chloroflexi bacterium]|nr:HNH endonuclease [Chloroflexota bacterium]